MRAVQSSEVKAELPEFLDEVERGEVIVITRHGKPVAHLVPAPDVVRERARKAIEGTREMRKTAKHTTVEEILAWRHERHKYECLSAAARLCCITREVHAEINPTCQKRDVDTRVGGAEANRRSFDSAALRSG